MIDHEDKELLPWECMYNYDGMTNRACLRLDEIAASERVMGYDDSAKMYYDTAVELRENRVWLNKLFQEMINALNSGA